MFTKKFVFVKINKPLVLSCINWTSGLLYIVNISSERGTTDQILFLAPGANPCCN